MINKPCIIMCPKCCAMVEFEALEESKTCKCGNLVYNLYNVPMKKEENER